MGEPHVRYFGLLGWSTATATLSVTQRREGLFSIGTFAGLLTKAGGKNSLQEGYA